MDLVPYIYHEVQDRDGSMLCAQHCLNNLLQQNLYTAMDLADMATDLDQSENATLGMTEQRTQSQNMDDTGFFSISVLEKALQVFDLSLVRWRSPEMAEYHDHPENQAAFVLNLSSHWLAVRRFASSPNRWYNLNSFLQHPEWISPTYLTMVLQQAEEEGYSVFVVRSLDVHAGQQEAMTLSLLPECQADLIGLEIGDPSGRESHATSSTYASVTRSNLPTSSSTPPQPAPSVPAPGLGPTDPTDLVAASLERSRANLERFQRQQAAAVALDPPVERGSRRRRQADVPDLFGNEDGDEDDDADVQVVETPRREREARLRREREREEQEMARAIAASLAESGQTAEGAPRGGANDLMEEDEELEDDDAGAFDFQREARLYDDEDAQLQAAIDASLQEQALPADWKPPTVEPVKRSAERAIEPQPQPKVDPVKETVDEEAEEEEEEEPVVEELSAEELRRKRLERFM
ncbi:hypothetical protein NliqN6_2362 [Naganishia liquefaciens]|uniref:Ataxin-3 homolog n=1 Tax=Naganishia liquefaciens TaxID=104408 RepID=A0A8H3YDY5_9TREE|nr:hypothetical protein NliqN6_2362 [Naganishia liquefaciens]